MRQFTHGSLFSGIGGFDLGFERAGFKTVWQVEIDPFCRKVLEKHWPNVPRFADIQDYGRRFILERPTVITGGFPCQDISYAGKGAGLQGERSGLWREMFRVISELRPPIAVVENVPALLERGIDAVLGDLARVGYDVEWNRIPACAFGATHSRPRVFLTAYSSETRWSARCSDRLGERKPTTRTSPYCSWWKSEPGVSRLVDGIPGRVDRLEALGNAVVPQIAEWIAQRIKVVLEQEESGPS